MVDGHKLRAARKRLGLAQMEAAALLDVSLVTYQRWEQGKARPQPYHFRQIQLKFMPAFQALGMELSDQDDLSPKLDDETACALATSSVPSTIDEASLESEVDEAHASIPMTFYLLSLAYGATSSVKDKYGLVRQAIKEFDLMNTGNKSYQITRREAISTLAAFPLATLGLSAPGSSVPAAQYGTALAHCAASLEACWELRKSSEAGDLALAFKSVSKYLPMLETIAQNAVQYRQEALDLAARYAIVKTVLGWHCSGPTTTIEYAKHAVAISKETGDISLQLSAYSKLAWTYFHDKRLLAALTAAQEAEALLLQYLRLPNVAPLYPGVQGQTYMNLALMQARNGKLPDNALGKALEIEPATDDHAFIAFTLPSLLADAGLVYCYRGDQAKAMEMLEQRVDPIMLTPRMAQTEAGRIETINTMTLSSLRAKDRDMERTIHLWKAGVEGAKTLKSEERFIEAVTNLDHMETAWPGELRIAELHDLMEHW